MSSEPNIHMLYEHTCQMEEELQELKRAFPEFLSAERNRMIIAARFFRLGLEVNLRPKMIKRPPLSDREERLQAATKRQVL